MQIPAFVWTALLALIPLLVNWLGGDYFGGQGWVAWAVLALGGLAKAIALYREQDARQGFATRELAAPHRRAWLRWLIG